MSLLFSHGLCSYGTLHLTVPIVLLREIQATQAMSLTWAIYYLFMLLSFYSEVIFTYLEYLIIGQL